MAAVNKEDIFKEQDNQATRLLGNEGEGVIQEKRGGGGVQQQNKSSYVIGLSMG